MLANQSDVCRSQPLTIAPLRNLNPAIEFVKSYERSSYENEVVRSVGFACYASIRGADVCAPFVLVGIRYQSTRHPEGYSHETGMDQPPRMDLYRCEGSRRKSGELG